VPTLSKYLFFEVCNNFCSLFISVGYQAFSEGTDWQFVEAPSCFDRFCQYDLEIHIWTIVGVKYFFIPMLVSLHNYFVFTVVRLFSVFILIFSSRHSYPVATLCGVGVDGSRRGVWGLAVEEKRKKKVGI